MLNFKLDTQHDLKYSWWTRLFGKKPPIVVTLQIRLDFQVYYNPENANITLQIESVISEEGGCSGKSGEYSVLYC